MMLARLSRERAASVRCSLENHIVRRRAMSVGGGKVEPIPLDKDVFGDGTVMMLNTPGHTPGHHSLLVRLPQMGNVLVSGDLAHFHENYDSNGVPTFNTD